MDFFENKHHVYLRSLEFRVVMGIKREIEAIFLV